MATTPNSGDIYNQAASLSQRSDTPGLNSLIAAWGSLQDFTGNWAVNTYNAVQNVASLIGGLVP